MSDLRRLTELRRQKSELEALIAEASEDGDVVGKLNFGARLDHVSEEILSFERRDAKVGEVAILFDGAPVKGVEAIDASFAALALTYFQGVVTRIYSSSLAGQLTSRGKVRGAALAGLDIRGVATGSFGFILEEKDSHQSSALKTPMREAIEEAAHIIAEFAQEDDDNFLIEVDDINPRVFLALAKFFRHLERSASTLKASLPDRQYYFARDDIARAYRRISDTHVKIEVVSWRGRLVGLSPIRRSFDFRRDGSDVIVTGKFSHQVSQDYLERIEGEDGITLGHRFDASIEIGTLRKSDGSISTSYTVTDLVEIS